MRTNLTDPRHRPPPGRPRTPSPGHGRAANQRPGMGLERAVQVVTAIVAPTTVLTALLFYFGWIRTNALFQYFGVDATVLGFTTQDYLLRSTEALYVPLGTLLVLGLAGVRAHGLVEAWLAGRRPGRSGAAARFRTFRHRFRKGSRRSPTGGRSRSRNRRSSARCRERVPRRAARS